MRIKMPSDAHSQYLIDIANIRQWDKEYYAWDKPSVPDSTYDAVKLRASKYENNYPARRVADSPLQQIGFGFGVEVSHLIKGRKRDRKMYSLGNAFSENDIKHFMENVPADTYILEYKYDGLGLDVFYRNGGFVEATTRGNGEIGEIVSHTATATKNIPARIGYKPNLNIRGEVVVSKEVFAKAKGEYSSPRNMAAGIMRSLSNKKALDFPLLFLPYEIVGGLTATQYDDLIALQELGFFIPWKKVIHKASLQEISKIYDECLAARDNCPWDTDGLVIKVNNHAARESYGYTAKEPKGAIAWKFPTMEVATVITNIVDQVGRTGVLTPKAVFEPPVLIDGVVVEQATLHNYEECFRKGYGIGSEVLVTRNGGVVPGIVSTINEAPHIWTAPLKCPECSSVVVQKGSEYFCSDINCPGRLVEALFHSCSKHCLDIKGFGIKMAEFLVHQGHIKAFETLLELPLWENILPEFQEKFGINAQKIYDQIVALSAQNKRVPWHKALFALGIPEVGAATAELIASEVLWENFVDTVENNPEKLSTLNGIGPVVLEQITSFVKDYRSEINTFLNILKPENHARNENAPLAAMIFVVTGTLSRPRDHYEKLIKENGGIVRPAVSSKTNYLLAGVGGGDKRNAAVKHNVPIIDEDAFNSLLGKDTL